MNDRRSLIVILMATLPIAAPVVALFFIRDLGSLIIHTLGGWVLVATLVFLVVKLTSLKLLDDSASDAQQSDATSIDR